MTNVIQFKRKNNPTTIGLIYTQNNKRKEKKQISSYSKKQQPLNYRHLTWDKHIDDVAVLNTFVYIYVCSHLPLPRTVVQQNNIKQTINI